jgi:rhodanese-related sulfurtransferase
MTEPGGLPPAIDVADLDRRLRASDEPRPLLVDVREPDEILAARIEGLVIMPLSQFGSRFQELPTDRPLLVICASGGRSGMASAHLLASGYSASNVLGGMHAWERAGLPLKRGPLAPGEGDLPG